MESKKDKGIKREKRKYEDTNPKKHEDYVDEILELGYENVDWSNKYED